MRHEFEYPICKVLCGFAFGGIFGGLILCLGDVSINMLDLDHYIWTYNLKEILFMLFWYKMIGLVFGFIPAFLTGIYCLTLKLNIKTWIDYIHLFTIGYILSFIYFLVSDKFFIKIKGFVLFSTEEDYSLFGFIGGISAIICGKLFLPKRNKES